MKQNEPKMIPPLPLSEGDGGGLKCTKKHFREAKIDFWSIGTVYNVHRDAMEPTIRVGALPGRNEKSSKFWILNF